MPMDAWWLYGISFCGAARVFDSARRRQPGALVAEHNRCATWSYVGTGPLNGLLTKSVRPSLKTSTNSAWDTRCVQYARFAPISAKYFPYPPRITVRSVSE